MSFVVAIDGPTSSGKSTIANMIAGNMKFVYIQTGSMYRCVALKMVEEGIAENELGSIKTLLDTLNIEFVKQGETQTILLNGKNVTQQIRTKEVTDFTSNVASISEVRHKLLEMQRKMAENFNVVMEGRDIGTNVFPNADVKFFLTAKPIVRARRKQEELAKLGENLDLQTVLESIYKWDEDAIKRKEGALKRAKNSIYIDNSEMQIEELKDIMLKEIRRCYHKKMDVER